MKRNDLKATLGSIRASEELIGRTMARIEATETKREARGGFSFGAGFRVAVACCAFMLVVGLGIYGAVNASLSELSEELPRAAEANEFMLLNDFDEENSHGLPAASSNVDELLAESDNIDGDWVIISGHAEALYFAGGEVESGKESCIVTVSVDGVEHTSGGVTPAGGEISLLISFDSESELNDFVSSYSADAYYLIVADENNGDIAWKAQKFIYK